MGFEFIALIAVLIALGAVLFFSFAGKMAGAKGEATTAPEPSDAHRTRGHGDDPPGPSEGSQFVPPS